MEDKYEEALEQVENGDFEMVDPKLWNNRDFVLKAVIKNEEAFRFASKDLKKERNFVLEAVKNAGYVLAYSVEEWEELKDDREIVLQAVISDGYALESASEKLQDDKEIVLAAVKNTGYALDFASERLQDDREIVLAAVKNTGYALEFASERLKNDEEIVFEAVKKNGIALGFAGKKPQNNRKIVLEAVKTFDDAFSRYASEELHNDPNFVSEVEKINEFYKDIRRYIGMSENELQQLYNQKAKRIAAADEVLRRYYLIQQLNEQDAIMQQQEEEMRALGLSIKTGGRDDQ